MSAELRGAAYRNASLPVDERVEDLLARMTLEEKAGQMVQNSVRAGMDGEITPGPAGWSGPTLRERIVDLHITHMNVLTLPEPRLAARWANHVQQLAASTRLGIPVTIASDPRHGSFENVGVSFASRHFSRWPEPLGMAAIRDPELMQRHGDVVRREYRAVGIAGALHPTIDLATEPRWARQLGTFGQDPLLTSELVVAYLQGLQGETLGAGSVAAMTKHFPGGGAQQGGEDPHFPYGREQVYPGGRFEDHLAPFRAAVDAGTAAIMPYYGMPMGLVRNGERIEEVGFGYNRQVLTGILREELGFDGVICTDWGLVSDTTVPAGLNGPRELHLPARAWGVEHLDALSRVEKILAAGADQLGGEDRPDLIVELVRSGRVSEQRIDASVRRLMRVKFQLGLFDNPYVSEEDAAEIVGADEFRSLGEAAQRRSIVLLRGGPHTRARRLLVRGIDEAVAAEYGEVVDDPADADIAIIRLEAPYEPRDELFLESMFRAGSLEFTTAQIEEIAAIVAEVPTVVDVFLDRPAILTPLAALGTTLIGSFGVSDAALLDVVLGRAQVEGRLPFELPSSSAAVEEGASDVPGGTLDPLFPFGHGL